MKKQRGCTEDTTYAPWTDLDGVTRKRCPRRPILEEPEFFNSILTAYNGFQSGILPKSGGLWDQHARYPAIMNVMHNAIEECDEKRKEQQAATDRLHQGMR